MRHYNHYLMFGIRPGRITFESHLEKLKEPVRPIMVDLRKFVISLGSNVIEEERPHRIVYSKTMNFRTFLDIESTTGYLFCILPEINSLHLASDKYMCASIFLGITHLHSLQLLI